VLQRFGTLVPQTHAPILELLARRLADTDDTVNIPLFYNTTAATA
jgi:hypothetical protein